MNIYLFNLETPKPGIDKYYIICSQTLRDGDVVGVLSQTKKLNGIQKGILRGLTNRIICKAQ